MNWICLFSTHVTFSFFFFFFQRQNQPSFAFLLKEQLILDLNVVGEDFGVALCLLFSQIIL